MKNEKNKQALKPQGDAGSNGNGVKITPETGTTITQQQQQQQQQTNKVQMRDEKAARAAFLANDPALSRAVHSKVPLSQSQKNKIQGILKSSGGAGIDNKGGSSSSSLSVGYGSNGLDVNGKGKNQNSGYGTLNSGSGNDHEEDDKLMPNQGQPEEGHRREGSFIKSVVFGGLDGILTSFSIVSGATGGGISTSVIVMLGLSNVFADALSMGLGDALSTKADHEYVMMERKREYWEFDNYPEGEIDEMIALYVQRGMSHEDASTCVRLMAEHRDFFVDVMMVEELGLQVPSLDENPWLDGFITFSSFLCFGSLPLVGYIVLPMIIESESGHSLSSDSLFIISYLSTAVALFVLGALKSRFSLKSWVYSGFEMFFIGSLVALIAYSLGAITNSLVGVDLDTGGLKNQRNN